MARIFRLLKNDKTLLMTNEDMFSKIVMTLSRIQKQVLGDGELQVSDVLDVFKKIKGATLASDTKVWTSISDGNQDIQQSAVKEYFADLKGQNMIDPWSLFKKLEPLFNCAGDENKEAIEIIKNSNVLMLLPDNFNDPKAVDMHIAKLLFSENNYQLNEVVLKEVLNDDTKHYKTKTCHQLLFPNLVGMIWKWK